MIDVKMVGSIEIDPAMKIECPKCQSEAAYFEKTRYDIILRCMCGYHKVISTTLETITIEHIDSGDKVSLPKKGSKLWLCLMMLCRLQPAKTTDIRQGVEDLSNINLTMKDVATQLTVLKYRGLSQVVESGKGVSGGSTWEITATCRRLLQGRK